MEASVEAAPYPGAKPYFLIPADMWEEGEWFRRLLQVTAHELPVPKAKAGKESKRTHGTNRR